jgi:hypothetical protein
MNGRELKDAVAILNPRCRILDRVEAPDGSDGLMAEWHGGGVRFFYSIDDVRRIEDQLPPTVADGE